MAKTDFKGIDEYIATFPQDVQGSLEGVRQAVRVGVPDAEEIISYQMPAFRYHGLLLYFAVFKNHYSLFIPSGPKVFEAFQQELSAF